MRTIREGTPTAWWRGMVGSCNLCGGEWQLETDDQPEYFDYLIDNEGLKYASPLRACPTIGCQGNVHFHPVNG